MAYFNLGDDNDCCIFKVEGCWCYLLQDDNFSVSNVLAVINSTGLMNQYSTVYVIHGWSFYSVTHIPPK